jgi:hypothetical protein
MSCWRYGGRSNHAWFNLTSDGGVTNAGWEYGRLEKAGAVATRRTYVCSAGRGSGRRLDWPLVRCSIWGSLCGRRRRMIGARSVVEFGQLAGNESPSKPCISYLRYTHCVCSLRKECPSRASFCFSDAEGLLHSTTTATDPPQPHTTTSCLPRAQNTGKPPPRRARSTPSSHAARYWV